MELKAHDLVFLSASVPHRPEWVADAKPAEIEEAVISVARAVFARGQRLVFGGHPSISPLIASVAGEYFRMNPDREVRPVVTFQSEFFKGRLPDETWELYRMGWAEIAWTPVVEVDGRRDQGASVDLMRRHMLLDPALQSEHLQRDIIARNSLAPPRAMVAIGGMEGIADEAAMFLEYRAQWDWSAVGLHLEAPARRALTAAAGGSQDGPASPSRPEVFLFSSGGGASARLLEPAMQFATRLWPTSGAGLSEGEAGRRQRRLDLLQRARDEGDFVHVEAEFRHERNLADSPESEAEMQPYAAMAQWLTNRVGFADS